MIKNFKDLPSSTKKRLIQLRQMLLSYDEEKITSKKISELSGWKDSLIRHDLFLLKITKGVSNGYFCKDLIQQINLAESEQKNCCIVGLGRLGAALLDENLVINSQFTIKAGFDSNLNRVEILRSNFPLYPANEMQFVIKKENIEYAILTVSDKDAQQNAKRLADCGIKGIVNMTNKILSLPKEIRVENLSILNSLQLLL